MQLFLQGVFIFDWEFNSGSGSVQGELTRLEKKMLPGQQDVFFLRILGVCVWYTRGRKYPSHSLSNWSFSPTSTFIFSHTCFELFFTYLHVKSSAHPFLKLLSTVPAWRDSGFESLGGRYQSLTQGLFAVRLHTRAETPGQGHMCLKVGGSG